MKLLLTSGGLTNKTIVKALTELVGKVPAETSLVFVPTASNVETGDKDWFINDLLNIHKQGFKSVAITDISAVPEAVWRPQFEAADVLFFEGGNTYHLMEWVNRSGLAALLPELLKTKVWVGVSAGSLVTNPDLITPAERGFDPCVGASLAAITAAVPAARPVIVGKPHLQGVTTFTLRIELYQAIKPVVPRDEGHATPL